MQGTVQGTVLIARLPPRISCHQVLFCPAIATCRLSFPAHSPSGLPLSSVDLLLVCDSYLGLDQQYSIPLHPGSGGTSGSSGKLPLLGQAARRARRAEQQEARRQHAASDAAGQGQQQGQAQGAAAPMDVDSHPQGQKQQHQQGQQQASLGSAGTGEALPQRAPRQPRGRGAVQQPAHAEATLDCRLAPGGG